MDVTSMITHLEEKTARTGKQYLVIHHNNEKGQFKQNCFENLAALGVGVGDSVTMSMEKNGQYWNLKSISKVTDNAPAPSPATPAPSPSSGPPAYVPDERKQVYIAKSVALKAALDYTATAEEVTIGQILDKADVFTKWLLQTQEEREEEKKAAMDADLFDELEGDSQD